MLLEHTAEPGEESGQQQDASKLGHGILHKALRSCMCVCFGGVGDGLEGGVEWEEYASKKRVL